MSEDFPTAPTSHGWDAIAAACDALYPDQPNPQHWGVLVPWAFGGPDPLRGVSAYRATEPVPHWHYVTYGYSDLYDQNPRPEGESGYGIEMTFRLWDNAALSPEGQAPLWPVSLLQQIGRYVFKTGNVIRPHEYMDANGPIYEDPSTTLTAMLFAEDPDLKPLKTPNGEVTFVQMIGVTADELEAAQNWQVEGIVNLIRERMPEGAVHPGRPSIMTEPAVRQAVEEGIRRDGSATGFMYVERIAVTDQQPRPILEVGAQAVELLVKALPTRLPFGKHFIMQGDDGAVRFLPTQASKVVVDDERRLTIELGPQEYQALLSALRPVSGDCVVPGLDVIFRVVPTQFVDPDGSISRTLG